MTYDLWVIALSSSPVQTHYENLVAFNTIRCQNIPSCDEIMPTTDTTRVCYEISLFSAKFLSWYFLSTGRPNVLAKQSLILAESLWILHWNVCVWREWWKDNIDLTFCTTPTEITLNIASGPRLYLQLKHSAIKSYSNLWHNMPWFIRAFLCYITFLSMQRYIYHETKGALYVSLSALITQLYLLKWFFLRINNFFSDMLQSQTALYHQQGDITKYVKKM